MKRSLICSAAAAAAVALAASSAMADLVYSFETLYDSTNNPNPAGTRPDDFTNNSPPSQPTVISQSTIGVTDGSYSMEFQQGAAASFTGAITQLIPAIIDDPSTTALAFDLTIPATGNFTGNFANLGISEFGNNASQGLMGAQVQTVTASEVNIALAPGTYHFTMPLIALFNPVTGDSDVPFSNCFGSDTSTQMTPSSFEFYINKSTDSALNIYMDNVTSIGLQTVGTWAHTTGGSWSTLADWTGGIPQVALDTANFTSAIAGDSTVTLDGNRSVGTLTFNNSHHYTIAQGTGGILTLDGGGSPTLTGGGKNTSFITDSGGMHTISAPVDLNTNTAITVTNAGDALNISGPISGVGHLTVLGNGTVGISGSNTYVGGTTVSSGVLLVGSALSLPSSNSVVSIATGAKVQFALGIGAPTVQMPNIAAGGTLDITNNHLFINYTTSDPISTVAADIKSGYNSGHWNGTGIMSTAAQTTTNGLSYGLGYADGADGRVSGLSSGQIEIKYTLLGDANLDGLVNAADFTILAANFNQPVTGWDQGDFNYDGLVNAADFTDLAANFNQSVSGAAVSGGDAAALDAFAAANGISLANVPEPASAGMMGMAGLGMVRRRRRR
ncbi:MAG: dockerin type I domain-containing protein [Tepidisphaeraceae bacterium]